eukprot:7987051-Prorocentrum_lima.AAC.1
MADRPLISQEMSTGYPNNETGHPTRIHYGRTGRNTPPFQRPSFGNHALRIDDMVPSDIRLSEY